MSVIRRTATLPDSANKTDFYTIIDSSTVDTIVNADISAAAAIADSKLAQISTADKVSAAALCSLAALPSGAGVIPAANIPSMSLSSIPNASILPLTLASWVSGITLRNLSSLPSAAGNFPLANLPSTRFSIGTVSRDLTAASGAVATTGVGFQPKVVLFMTSTSTTFGPFSIGVDDGTNHYCISTNNNSGDKNSYNSAGSVSIDISSGNNQTASISALGADGFTLDWTKTGSPTGTAVVIYLAFA